MNLKTIVVLLASSAPALASPIDASKAAAKQPQRNMYTSQMPCTRRENFQLAWPHSCRMYLVCDHGRREVKTCPEGFIYWPSVGICAVGSDEDCDRERK